MSANEKPSCIFCPSTLSDNVADLRKMDPYSLRQHTAACHVDNRRSVNSPVEYSCNGIGSSSSCNPAQKHRTLAVTSHVNHMRDKHPEETLPFSVRYKASLSDFMAELSMFNSSRNIASPTKKAEMDLQRRAIFDQMLLFSSPNRAQGFCSNSAHSKADSENFIAAKAVTAVVSAKAVIEFVNERGATRNLDAGKSSDPASMVSEPASVFDPQTKTVSPSEFKVPTTAAQPIKRKGAIRRSGPSPKKHVTAKGFSRTNDEPTAVPKVANANGSPGENLKTSQECMKCHQSISVGKWKAMNTFNHAATHMKKLAFECKLCGAQYRSQPAWHGHFGQYHANEKRQMQEGQKRYQDYLIDKRDQMKDEIAQALKECFGL